MLIRAAIGLISMKRPWVQLLVVALLGIMIGRFLPVGRANTGLVAGEEANEPGMRRSTKVSNRQHSGTAASSLSALRKEIHAARPDQLPNLVYRSLEIADHAERWAVMLEAFKHADASNVRAIYKEFAKITRETGRINHEEWRLALFEVGRIGGAEVMETWIAEARGLDEMSLTLYGVAFADPKAAMDWYNGTSNTDYPKKERLLPLLIGGATLKNAEEGIRMMEELPVKNRLNCVGHFSWNLIQKEGLDRAVDWMLEVRKSSAATEPGYAKAVEDEIYNKLFGAAEWTGGARELAGHLARIHQDTPIAPNRMLSTVSRMHGNYGLDLMDELARNPATANSEALELAVTQVAGKSAKNSPAEVNKWLERHPASPLAPRIQQMMSGSAAQ